MDTGIKKQVLDEILMAAEKNNIEKVILFGSRARGDYRKTSDIDLAVSGGRIAHFQADIEEEVSTLLSFDIVNMDGSVQEELVDSIKREGKVLYEKI
ncbi:putative uncharacterized protein [Firmicutes bacterium CAG:238]|jgi:predicted nucleotidyltransferase|nr:putative uncharacterized protein [Firmicutes bacterium CAG:238]